MWKTERRAVEARNEAGYVQQGVAILEEEEAHDEVPSERQLLHRSSSGLRHCGWGAKAAVVTLALAMGVFAFGGFALRRAAKGRTDASPATLMRSFSDAAPPPWAAAAAGGGTGAGAKESETCAANYQDDCRSKSCCDKYATCYAKNGEWAACRPTCALGFPEDAPPWDPSYADKVPWSCEVVGKAPAPATWKPTTASPSLYCFLVALVLGNEPELLRRQVSSGSSIFGCNAFSIFSELEMIVGEGPDGVIKSTAIGGPMHSSKSNIPDFLRAWKKAREEGTFKQYDWSVKVDPDAVFLPMRLRPKLEAHSISTGVDPVFFKNCEKYGSVQGPLEVFSKAAASVFFESLDICKSQGWIMERGEDWFFHKCLEQIGCQAVEDYGLLDDQWCTHTKPSCGSGMPAYHPFKTVEGHMACLEEAQQR